MKTVYLAGPITGLKFGECTDWRVYAVEQLARLGIEGLSPMRGKDYLIAIAKDIPFTSDGDKYAVCSPLSTNRGITTRDRFDTTRCDVILVNLLGAKQVSIGTVMEIAWADLCRTPIVAVMEKEGNPHHHGMVLDAIGFRADSLDEGIALCGAILNAKPPSAKAKGG